MKDINKQFGQRVRTLRKEKGLSQEELAKLIDRDVRSVNAIENGNRNPTLETIVKIAKALNTGVATLFTN